MPGFIYEVDKLGNKIISRDPNFRKSDKKLEKAKQVYNE
jgi:hypothetical protein